MLDKLEIFLSDTAKRILFVGIGNVLRRDDGAGVYVTRGIETNDHILTLTVETSIENYIGKINSIDPDILVLVDCTELKGKPGTIRFLSVGEIEDITFNTHNISLKQISEFFRMPVFIIGVQPLSIGFGEMISPDVLKSADRIIQLVNMYATAGSDMPAER